MWLGLPSKLSWWHVKSCTGALWNASHCFIENSISQNYKLSCRSTHKRPWQIVRIGLVGICVSQEIPIQRKISYAKDRSFQLPAQDAFSPSSVTDVWIATPYLEEVNYHYYCIWLKQPKSEFFIIMHDTNNKKNQLCFFFGCCSTLKLYPFWIRLSWTRIISLFQNYHFHFSFFLRPSQAQITFTSL